MALICAVFLQDAFTTAVATLSIASTMAGEQMQSFVNVLADNENAWLITEKQSGACIGYVTMDIPYPQLAIGETGYVIGEKYQRKGVGKCAKRY